MIIKFSSATPDQLGSKDAILIEGTDIKTGEPWSKKIFANQKNKDKTTEMSEVLTNTGVGEILNVAMVKKGNYWNVSNISPATATDITKARGDAPAKTNYTPKEGGSGAVGKASSYEWKGRTAEAYDRSAAIYLALDLLKHNSQFAAKKADQVVSEGELYRIAEEAYKYIHDGVTPFEDALDPPEMED